MATTRLANPMSSAVATRNAAALAFAFPASASASDPIATEARQAAEKSAAFFAVELVSQIGGLDDQDAFSPRHCCLDCSGAVRAPAYPLPRSWRTGRAREERPSGRRSWLCKPDLAQLHCILPAREWRPARGSPGQFRPRLTINGAFKSTGFSNRSAGNAA